MEHELKPCPRCGKEGKIYIRKWCKYLGKFFAACKSVNCPACTPYVENEDEAISAWNNGNIRDIASTEAEIEHLWKMASRVMRVRVREGALTGKLVHYFDKGVFEFSVQDKDVPSIKFAYTETIEDAAYIAAANPATILALIHELRACRAKLRIYEQQSGLSSKKGEI